jgi:hypothetical protein
MMRYRLSNRTPGAKRPWLIESDELSQPLDGALTPAGGVLRGKAPGADWVAWLAPIVTAPDSAGDPHEAQNRAASGRTARQLTQSIAGDYAP